MDDEQFLDLVDRLTDENFLAFVEQFAQENCAVFAGFETEHLHCFHTLHQQYQRLFESRAEAWFREKGLRPEVLAISADKPASLARDLADSLLAVSDYQAFVTMMRRRVSDSGDQVDDADAGTGGTQVSSAEMSPTEDWRKTAVMMANAARVISWRARGVPSDAPDDPPTGSRLPAPSGGYRDDHR
ncbi:unnamed protein product [Cladocopium goreaui]|uniref:Cilia- and flagella-associated protein 36 (Coiled-coil domain-containing protein 104) n=1 Tax=Cladocopium goreaui TaxID=2562237 RepID=A0A9P1FNH9_9DINO|nr:unnamed protein product [Cladocopium goreaui]